MRATGKLNVASIQKITTVEELKSAMAHVFQDAQVSLAGHRKLVMILKNLFGKSIELEKGDYFNLYFTKLVNKILPLKKGEKSGDRIAKFCSAFVASLSMDEIKRKQENEDEEVEEDDNEEETYSGVFSKYLVHHLLRGIESKDKWVRYRVVQLLAYLVHYIGEIDRDSFEALYTSLMKRLNDREAIVRIQAIVAVSKFQEFDLDGYDYTYAKVSNQHVKDVITETLQYDESAEVRRAALLNVIKENNNDTVLERARDNNGINRRLVYSRIVKEVGSIGNLNFEEREFLLKWGLNDRDPSVQQAATKMLTTTWFDAVNEDLLSLVSLLKVTESTVAGLALETFFEVKPAILDTLKFDENYWKELTIDKAFLLRSFYDHCNKNNLYDLIEPNFPESIDLANILEKYFQLRLKVFINDNPIHKKYEKYDEILKSRTDELNYSSNQLIKANLDVENIKKSIQSNRDDVLYYEKAMDMIRKRLKKLSKNDESTVGLVADDIDKEILDEMLEVSVDDLKVKLVELKDSILHLNNEHSKLADLSMKIEIKQKKLIETYESARTQIDEINDGFERDLDYESEIKDLEFILHQLLLVAKEFDFSDEMGRRKMLQIIRNSLTEHELTKDLIGVALNVLRKLSINEKDFIAMSTEIITDIRDSYEEENETFHSAIEGFGDEDEEEDDEDDDDGETETSSKKRRVDPKFPPDNIVVTCLIITSDTLQLIEEPLETHLALGSIYSGLVNYAISAKEKYSLHLLGLKCLGLYSLIDKSIATDAISTFYNEIRYADEETRIIGIKAVADILSTFGTSILTGNVLFMYARLFYKSLTSFKMPNLQCVVAEGLCKLFLADIFNARTPTDESTETQEALDEYESEKQLFEALVLSYFHPLTSSNAELRQILAFCIPVYSFSHPQHQFRLASISGDCIYRMFNTQVNDFSNLQGKLNPTQIVQQLIYWCDPNNLVNLSESSIKKQTSHLWQSVYFLQVLEQETPKNIKRIIINNLSKFYIKGEVESKVLLGLLNAVKATRELISRKVEIEQDPEFNFDKPTFKNFENFEKLIELEYERSKTREEAELSNVRSRSNSILGGLDDVEDLPLKEDVKDDEEKEDNGDEQDLDQSEIMAANTSINAPPQEDEDIEDNGDVEEDEAEAEEVDNESNKKDVSMTEEEKQKQSEVNSNLDEIDKFLDDEDNVEYDISMDE
ncbi:nuclear condensing complex subunit [Scheffersomyces coipomensis]|uniref:nuclear condensing complex subunit n=1 Tax=Scheffersomyces coipomensis TaxID=1788519 RepID=UPI00315DAD43